MNQWYALYRFREYGFIFYVNARTLGMGTRNMHRPACVVMIFGNTVSPNRHQSISNHADFTLIMVPCVWYYVIGMAIKPLNKACSRQFLRSASRHFCYWGICLLAAITIYDEKMDRCPRRFTSLLILCIWQVAGIIITCNAYLDDYFVLVTRNDKEYADGDLCFVS